MNLRLSERPATPGRLSDRQDDLAWLAACSAPRPGPHLAGALAELQADAAGDAWAAYAERIAAFRSQLAGYLGTGVDHLALMPSASVGAFQVIGALRGGAATTVLTSYAEFPSLAQVWQRYTQVCGGMVHDADDAGPRTPDTGGRYLATLHGGARPDLVSVPLVAYDTGERLPVEEICGLARAAGALSVVDAYQYVGTGPLSPDELGCDAMIAGTSKYLLGLPGLAFVWLRNPDAAHQPLLTGWFGRRDPMAFGHGVDFPNTARALETGTLAVPAVYAATAGLDVIGAIDPDLLWQHRTALTELAEDALLRLGRAPLTPREPHRRGAHLALPSTDSAGEAGRLRDRGVVCSPRGDLLRIAFHVGNTPADVDRLIDALAMSSVP